MGEDEIAAVKNCWGFFASAPRATARKTGLCLMALVALLVVLLSLFPESFGPSHRSRRESMLRGTSSPTITSASTPDRRPSLWTCPRSDASSGKDFLNLRRGIGFNGWTHQGLMSLPVRADVGRALFDSSSFNRNGGNLDWSALVGVWNAPVGVAFGSHVNKGTGMAPRAFVLLLQAGPGCVHSVFVIDETIPDKWRHVVEIDGAVVHASEIAAFTSSIPWVPPFVPARKKYMGRVVRSPLCFHKQFRWSLVPPANATLSQEEVDLILACNRDTVTKCPIRIYFQFTGVRFDQDASSLITAWNGSSLNDVPGASTAKALMEVAPGEAPAGLLAAGQNLHRSLTLRRGMPPVIVWRVGPGTSGVISRIVITPHFDTVATTLWRRVRLKITFDGHPQPQVNTRLCGLFGGFKEVAWSGGLLSGRLENGQGYSYYPMPFWDSAVLELELLGDGDPKEGAVPESLDVQVELTVSLGRQPYSCATSGYFHVQEHIQMHKPPGEYFPWVDIERGRWGNIIAHRAYVRNTPHLSPADGMQEGDFIFVADGIRSPLFHGTGFEDHFYFAHSFSAAPKLFSSPLWGCPFHSNGYSNLPDGRREQNLEFEAYRYTIDGEFAFSDGAFGVLETGSTPSAVNTNHGDFYTATMFYASAPVRFQNTHSPSTPPGYRKSSSLSCGAVVASNSSTCLARDAGDAVYGSGIVRTLVVDVGDDKSEAGAMYNAAAGCTPFSGDSSVQPAKRSYWRFWGMDELKEPMANFSFRGRRWKLLSDSQFEQALAAPPGNLSNDRRNLCSTFVAPVPSGSYGCFLRRVHDAAGVGVDAAHVFVDAAYAGLWLKSMAQPRFRLSEDTFTLRQSLTSNRAHKQMSVTIAICPLSTWNEIQLGMFCWI